jgi:hypothetical protein
MKQVVGINVRGEATGLLSVVVPAYNDEKSLAAFHECLRDVVDKIPMETEIIYVIRDENGWRYVISGLIAALLFLVVPFLFYD